MPTLDGTPYENEGLFADVALNNFRFRLRTKITGTGHVVEIEDFRGRPRRGQRVGRQHRAREAPGARIARNIAQTACRRSTVGGTH